MSIKNEFSKHANDYNSYNIIQQIVAKSIVRDITNEPRSILELGCGSGQIIRHIKWDYDHYCAVDFSDSMCDLHPKSDAIEVHCYDFDSDEFFDFIKNRKFEIIVSSSAMQWSKDLNRLVSALSKSADEIYAGLFTSNTFKTIQKLSGKKSPILDTESIKESFSDYFECEFELYNYNLEFDSKKELFDYIKNSGVSGGNDLLSFKDAKRLYREYDLNYLEFEVIFVKAFSRS